jgi:membrane fusion protein, multidrug efflux system
MKQVTLSLKSTLAAIRGASILFLFLAAAIITPSVSEGGETGGRIRVQLWPLQQTTLSSEISAKLSNVLVREGETFKEGQTLVTFDCSIMEAQRKKAKASAESARQTLKVNRRLAELGSISTLEVDQSETKVKETEAELEAMETVVSKCELKAPFTGRVAKLYVENHQYLTPGKPLLDIVDTLQLEVRLIVSSRWLSWLRKGTTFSVSIEETGKTYRALVTRINPRIDPVSQSISLTASIAGSHPELLPGMSGWANFKK